MNITTKKGLLAGLVGLFAAGGMTQAVAQGGEAASSQVALDEIIVTAEKRSQNLQDVPIAITAFSADRLERSGIESSTDLEMVTPGLNFASDGRLGKVSIRGIGATFLFGPGTDPSSSSYLDGVYLSRDYSALIDMLDLERVEVLKGPQGTLYGRNATGGAIKYVSKDPAPEFGGKLGVKAGNYGMLSTRAEVDLPLIADELLFHGTIVRTTRDGYTENLLSPAEKIDFDDLLAGHFTLKYLPSNSLELTMHGGFVEDEGDFAARKHFNIDAAGLVGGATQIDDPRKIMADQGPRSADLKSWFVDVNINWDLGWADLSSITAIQDVSAKPWREDLDATEISALHQGEPGVLNGYSEETETISQEFLLSSQNEVKMDWLLGLYYIHDEPKIKTGISVPLFAFFEQLEGLNETDAYAAFGHISYQLSDTLRFNAGLRYSYEEKEFTLAQFVNHGLAQGPVTQDANWDAWTPKIGLDYYLNDEVMLYVSASRGFKSGAFNSSNEFGPAVNPEFINAYEVGVKSMLFNDRLRLNLSAFNYDYTDLQVQGIEADSLSVTLKNAAEAKIKGLEIDLSALPSEQLQVDLGVSWLDAEYTDFPTLDQLGLQSVNLKGNTLPNAPELTVNLGLQHSTSIAETFNLQFRVDYYYSSEKFFNEFNDPIKARQESYSLVNARMSVEEFGDANWRVSLFGKNLTDELVLANTLSIPLLFGDGFIAPLNPPRTYGVEFEIKF